MRKLTPEEGITLLKVFSGQLDITNVAPDDYISQETLRNLCELELLNAYPVSIDDFITDKGLERIHQMLAFGINYKQHFKNASIKAKQAAFLSLINSGYEPRGLWTLLFKKGTWSQIKNAFYQVKNSKVESK